VTLRPHFKMPLTIVGGGPERRNRATNPSAERNLAGHSGASGSVIERVESPEAPDGDYLAEVTNTADALGEIRIRSDDPVPCTPGEVIGASITGRVVSKAGSSWGNLACRIIFLDAEGVAVETPLIGNAEPPVEGHWYTFSGEATVPVGAVAYYLRMRASTAVATDFIWQYDMAFIGEPGPYFPTAAQLTIGIAEFTGPLHESESVLHPTPATLAEVEQDSVEEIEQCVEAILRTIVGTHIDDLEFGIPDESFTQQTPNPSAEVYIAAIEEQEPRARQLGRARLEELATKVVTIESEGVAGV
jgi:hypothetical protein